MERRARAKLGAFYPLEKFASRFTDAIITINNEDYEFAKSHFKKPRVLRSNGIGVNLGGYAFDADIRREKEKALGLKTVILPFLRF